MIIIRKRQEEREAGENNSTVREGDLVEHRLWGHSRTFLCVRNQFENTGLTLCHFHRNQPGRSLARSRAHRPVLVRPLYR